MEGVEEFKYLGRNYEVMSTLGWKGDMDVPSQWPGGC